MPPPGAGSCAAATAGARATHRRRHCLACQRACEVLPQAVSSPSGRCGTGGARLPSMLGSTAWTRCRGARRLRSSSASITCGWVSLAAACWLLPVAHGSSAGAQLNLAGIGCARAAQRYCLDMGRAMQALMAKQPAREAAREVRQHPAHRWSCLPRPGRPWTAGHTRPPGGARLTRSGGSRCP